MEAGTGVKRDRASTEMIREGASDGRAKRVRVTKLDLG